MGTRGTCGFRLNGQDKLAYNHFDSYPSGLGTDIARQVQAIRNKFSPGELRTLVGNLVSVNEDTTVTPELMEATKPYHDLGVSEQSVDDPYCLFRGAQGNVMAYLEMGYMLENGGFIRSSLFCEWGYIVNLDSEMLEVWEGFQKSPNLTNRYGQEQENGYYPCLLVAEFPLESVTPEQIKALEV